MWATITAHAGIMYITQYCVHRQKPMFETGQKTHITCQQWCALAALPADLLARTAVVLALGTAVGPVLPGEAHPDPQEGL